MSDRNCPDCMINEDALGPGIRCAFHEIEYLKSELSVAKARIKELEMLADAVKYFRRVSETIQYPPISQNHRAILERQAYQKVMEALGPFEDVGQDTKS